MLQGKAALHATARVVFAAYAYMALEWLFFATKPSFLTAAPFSAQVGALAIGAIPPALVALALHLVALVLAWGLGSWARARKGDDAAAGEAVSRSWQEKMAGRLPQVVPSLLIVLIGLILFDNFTYTFFGWGVVRAKPLGIVLYLGIMAWAFVVAVRNGEKRGREVRGRSLRLAGFGALGLLVLSSLSLLVVKGTSEAGEDPAEQVGPPDEKRALPNIILFASDGIDASRTSAYGYHRKTTPNLDRYLERGLVFENAFTNSGWTTGSVTSMATGQHPATTKVLYPPYVLQGRDAYHTLPRILRKLGYRNIQETVRYYADGPDLNWQQSFDYANDRRIRNALLSFEPGLQLPSVFVQVVETRLTDRIAQLLSLRKVVNPHDQVSGKSKRVYGVRDEDRMQRVFDFIDGGEGPFFAHIHLMGTHCCTFKPKNRRFSLGEFDPPEGKVEAAYDDTIFESDEFFGDLMSFLEDRGLLENTLIVYSSDHTKGWGFQEQVPLIFFFPRGEHRGWARTPAQLLDVAPTILDYLGIESPPWLEGSSLLGEGLRNDRPIFAISRLERGHFKTDRKDRLAHIPAVGPPAYGLAEMGMVVCQRWYTLKIEDGTVDEGDIPGYTTPCNPAALPSKAKAREMMSLHLKERGFSF